MQKQPKEVDHIMQLATQFGSLEILRYVIDNYPDESSDVRPKEIPPTQELEDFWIERLISMKATDFLLRWIKNWKYCRKILGILEQRGLLEHNLSWWIDNLSDNYQYRDIWTVAFDFFVKLEWSPDVYITIWSKYGKSFTLEHMEAIQGWEEKWTAYADHVIRANDMKKLEQVENYCRDRNLVRGLDYNSMQKYIDDPKIDNSIKLFISEKVCASS
jgi:hypothetical protein